jgi:hypothetical protein
MSLPRLIFLYPALHRRAPLTIHRYRHGTAVQPPTQLHQDPPPAPPPPKTDSDTETKSKLKRDFLAVAAEEEEAQGNVAEALSETVGVQDTGKEIEAAAATGSPGETVTSSERGDKTASPPSESNNGISTTSSTFAPREYAHHFDTYTSVQRLERSGGFKRNQSIAIMKGIRSLLQKNMTAARENLVSRSDLENETYLFQAACSELRNEMQNAKKVQMDQLRSERTRIQTEFDLLNQAFLAEIMSL